MTEPQCSSAVPNSGRPLLSLRKICKAFPGVLANDRVDLDIQPGEIHALLGENGAGKSTLVSMIYGLLRPDAGEILLDGAPASIHSPNDARALGIGMVFQHFSLFEALSVAENIALGMAAPGDMKALAERIEAVAQAYGLPLDPADGVHALSVGQRQRIEVVRCLLQEPRLLIMDEPTSVLTPQEVEKLFGTLRRLAGEGCSILYISHKLDEIQTLCERATILRNGRVVGECDPRRENARSLAEMMIGTDLKTPSSAAVNVGEIKLQVRNLVRAPADDFAVALQEVTFEVRAGEILGIAGVAGNGQAELLQVLSGEALAEGATSIEICGQGCGNAGVSRRRALGLAFVPEERQGHGAVAEMSLVENAALSSVRRRAMVAYGFIRYGRARCTAEAVCERFNVKQAGVDSMAMSLSGGNLQKFIVGREIMQAPEVLIVSQPTWGVDAGSAAAIHQALLDLARDGAAVLAVSQDLDELLTICDRVAVIFHGRLSVAQPASAVTAQSLGLLMGGAAPGAAGDVNAA